MALQSFKANLVGSEGDSEVRLTLMQRYMLRRFHPQALFIDVVALIWSVYFVWHHQVLLALLTVIADRLIGNALASKMDHQFFAQTVWGKLALLHLHGANISIQIAGSIVTVYGLWVHSTLPILMGISIILLGHLFGWNKIVKGL